ncbi:MAG: hypothetical protein PWQ96_1831 [Clostridia bacterium]|jgi:hypothetical protein|nr:hypothetical protein [Clostridiales bacterium]MDK2986187.1 hypothetical protein [Clostridia bacterium]
MGDKEIFARALKYEGGMLRIYKNYLQNNEIKAEIAKIIRQLIANKEKDIELIKYLNEKKPENKSSCDG